MINTSKLFSTEDIAGLLRQADFSAENNGFKSQLRNRLQSYSEDMECETPEQLIELAKTEGIELTRVCWQNRTNKKT